MWTVHSSCGCVLALCYTACVLPSLPRQTSINYLSKVFKYVLKLYPLGSVCGSEIVHMAVPERVVFLEASTQ